MRSERGEMERTMLLALGVAVLVVWLVPMVLLRRPDVARPPAPGTVDPVPVAGATAPEAADPPAGSVDTAPEETLPTDPIGAANDLQAQALLDRAIGVAQVWFAEQGSYAGFGPEQAAQLDPSIPFTTGAAAEGSVTIRVTPQTAVLVTLSGGEPLCAAAQMDVLSYGRADAGSPAECTGGWG
jgi:hypothetical protein